MLASKHISLLKPKIPLIGPEIYLLSPGFREGEGTEDGVVIQRFLGNLARLECKRGDRVQGQAATTLSCAPGTAKSMQCRADMTEVAGTKECEPKNNRNAAEAQRR